MILLDNDALLKLASYDLIDEALQSLQLKPGDVAVLPTAKYALLPTRNRLLRCKDEQTASRLEAFLAACSVIPQEQISPELLDKLTGIQSLDAGEAVLFAYAASNPDAIVVTGDKRAVGALATADVADALSGRVMVLESLVAAMVLDAFAPVQEKVRSKPQVDKSLANVFGRSAPASIDGVVEGLDSYIRYLIEQTGALLWRPPD
jgi:hypothetical protein